MVLPDMRISMHLIEILNIREIFLLWNQAAVIFIISAIFLLCGACASVKPVPTCIECKAVKGEYDRDMVEEVCFPSKRIPEEEACCYTFYCFSNIVKNVNIWDYSTRCKEKIKKQIRARFPNFHPESIGRYITSTIVRCEESDRSQVFMKVEIPKNKTSK